MLPILKRRHAPALICSEIEQAAYFEILLFRTRLRFKNPPANVEQETNLYGEKGTDKRPFVNTVSKKGYLCAEEIGLCFETLYTTGWQFFPKGWFKPAYASLHLSLVAHAVVSSEQDVFPDLMKSSTSLAWISQKYRREFQAFNEMTLEKSGDDFQLLFHDLEWAKQQADQREFIIEPLSINGVPVFKGRPEATRVEFFVPFSPEDILQFSFNVQALQPLNEGDKADFIARASTWVDTIMQSLELELNGNRLENP